MSEYKRSMRGVAFALSIAAFVLGGMTSAEAATSQETVKLAYKFSQGVALSYKQSGSQIQYIDAMGQTITQEVNANMDITLNPKGSKDGNYLLGVTLDGIAINIQGAMGAITPDLSGIIGKSFDLVFSPTGKEVDVSGASALVIDMGQSGRRDLSSNFQGLFPDLPDHPVKIGDKWPTEDTNIQKSDAGDVRTVYKNESTLDGFETIDGRECARIKIAIKGTISGTLNQGGMSVVLDAKLDGAETWHFAVKEGIFVKTEMKASVSGTIFAEAMNASIGYTGEQKSTTELVKK